jgi:hypothetical protein
MSSRSLAVLLAGTALLLGGSFPAAAIEPDAAAKALAAALVKGSHVEATYDSAELDGSNVDIKGFKVTRTSEQDAVTFDDVVIENPTDSSTGIFESPKITFTGGTLSGESNGTLGDATVTEVTVLDATKDTGAGVGGSILFHTAEANDLKVTRKDQPGEVTIDRFYVETGNVVDNVAQDSKGSVEGITIPSTLFPAGSSFKPDAIGYDKLILDVSWDGTRDMAARTMTIRDFTLSIEDGGDLSIEGLIGEIPDAHTLNDPGAASGVTKTQVHNLTIRYDDKSLAGRVLDFLAKQQNLSRADYAKQISAALPFLLAALNNQPFQEQVATALGGFLQDPKSLTIEIAPEAPVSGDDLITLAKTQPGAIPEKLNASVTANTPE